MFSSFLPPRRIPPIRGYRQHLFYVCFRTAAKVKFGQLSMVHGPSFRSGNGQWTMDNGHLGTVSQFPIEQTLKDLANAGTLVKDRGYRQVWCFGHEGKNYYLKFYPRRGAWW